jgi:hypothetical protein
MTQTTQFSLHEFNLLSFQFKHKLNKFIETRNEKIETESHSNVNSNVIDENDIYPGLNYSDASNILVKSNVETF